MSNQNQPKKLRFLTKGTNTSQLQVARVELDAVLQRRAGEENISVSTESMDTIIGSMGATPQTQDFIDSLVTDIDQVLKNNFSVSTESFGDRSTGFGTDGEMTQAQVQAVGQVAVALSSAEAAKKYFKAATTVASLESHDNVTVINPSQNPMLGYFQPGDLPETITASLEAFDARALDGYKGLSLMMAFNAPIQNEFGEGFFKTVTLSADQAGIDLSIRRTMVYQEQRHDEKGKPLPWKQVNLLDAESDHTILSNKSTKVYPRVIVGDTVSESHFVDKALIAPRKIPATNGVIIDTAPLRTGKRIDIVGLAINEAIPGQMDDTDSLDGAMSLEKLYFKVTSKAGKTSIIPVDVRGLARSNFIFRNQGKDRRLDLNFDIQDILFNGETLDIASQPAEALDFLRAAPFAQTHVRYETLVSGNAHVQQGTIQVQGGVNPEIVEAREIDTDGRFTTIIDQTTLDTLVGEITEFELVAFDIDATLSNINRRQLGTLLDSVEETVKYIVPLSAPISVRTPITDTATQADLAGPMNAQRIVNSNNAVTKLLEVRDTLRNIKGQIDYKAPVSTSVEIEGFARLMVHPGLFDDTINVASVMRNISSHQTAKDLNAVLTNKLRYAITHLYTETRLQPFVDSINGTAGQRPSVVIGTDPTIASYLAVEGDLRTLIGFQSRVVVSYDFRMRGKIAAAFVRPEVADIDAASFGCMALIPQLVTKAVLNYNGSNTEVTQVQNRTLHICTLPILAWIEVEGLEDAASKEVDFSVSI